MCIWTSGQQKIYAQSFYRFEFVFKIIAFFSLLGIDNQLGHKFPQIMNWKMLKKLWNERDLHQIFLPDNMRKWFWVNKNEDLNTEFFWGGKINS